MIFKSKSGLPKCGDLEGEVAGGSGSATAVDLGERIRGGTLAFHLGELASGKGSRQYRKGG